MNNELLRNYAKLTVNIGINLQKGQEVKIYASTAAAYFAKYLVEEAYLAGAKKVNVEWSNDEITKLKYLNEDLETLKDLRPHELAKAKEDSEYLPCKIYVEDEDPDAFKGVDVDKMQAASAARYKLIKPYRDLEENNDQWCIVAIPSPAWAAKVFPELDAKEGVAKLWEAIIKCARLEGDVVANWHQHIDYLQDKASKMNALNLDYLQYKSSNGTDLRLKLQPNHVWIAASETNLKGVTFVANMPTEEVFTMPKRDGVDGVVYSTKPLSLHGQLVEDFKVVFEKGKVVEVSAKRGLDVLEGMLNMDESSRHLGEVALVPYSSPINQTGLLFYNTLFDENAACHLAFGCAFKNNIQGYEKMSEEDFKKVDFNDSLNHVDFMVGSKDLAIIGYDHEGKSHQIFKDGNWAI